MREITRSVKDIAVVIVDVDLSYWTSKVEHLVALPATVSNICTAHAQKRLFCTSGVDTAVRFADHDFLLGCKIQRCFTLIFAFNILIVRRISTSGLFDLLT